MQNQKVMNLVLSTDAKPRLKWTPEIHQRFVEAVSQLGGPDKATPKSLMRVMAITGLTLYHLKSHLQKYRLGKSQQSETSAHLKLEEMQRKDGEFNGENCARDDGSDNHMNESLKISQALELQLEVQKRLHEQIEVQRHLQLRIEAQGKYLQSVLRKAQETIAGYSCSSEVLEQAKAELSQLASKVSSGCQSSSLSELTDSGELNLKDIEREEMRVRMCSIESSLTSSESSEETLTANENEDSKDCNTTFERKRKERNSIAEGDNVSFLSSKRCTTQKEKSDDDHNEFRSCEMIDLNAQVDIDSDAALELNSKGMGSQLIEYL